MKPGALRALILPCGTCGRVTARWASSASVPRSRQTNANETPSPSILNGYRGSHWLSYTTLFLPCWPTRLFYLPMASCSGLQSSAVTGAVTGPPDVFEWLRMSSLETAASGCMEAPVAPRETVQSNGPARSEMRSRSRDLSAFHSLVQDDYTVK